jgi:hypothetical protein
VIFQTLDDKKHCVGIFYDGSIIRDQLPEDISKTWSYAAFLKDLDIEYANLYLGGKTLGDVYPPELEGEWQRISQKMKAFIRAFKLAKISLKDVCFYDLIPGSFLLEWCDIKTKICEHIFESYEKPANYNFLLELTKVLETIKYQKLNVDVKSFKNQLGEYKSRAFLKKVHNCEPYIRYNLFGTVTGRLTTEKNSFPILTLNKDYRKILKPNNTWFVEMDFNAAEFRTFLALNGEEQPQEDIHTWNIENVFQGVGTREEAKTRLFAWLYNPNSEDHLLNRMYDRERLFKENWKDGKITTKFDRIIEVDERRALNYLIQSTSSDLFLRQMIKINKILENSESRIAFSLHDSVIIDMAEQDKYLLPNLIEVFSDTDFGKYLVNVKAGKTFGNMRKLR